MSDDKRKWHLEVPGPTGWETACGRRSSSLTNRPDEVDCTACKRAKAYHNVNH